MRWLKSRPGRLEPRLPLPLLFFFYVNLLNDKTDLKLTLLCIDFVSYDRQGPLLRTRAHRAWPRQPQ